jgi:flagellin-like protein
MFLNKKAVSPLIATVLLVMIVVSIGAAIMVVIQGLTNEQLNSISAQQAIIKCGSDVNVGLITVGTTYRVCINQTGDAPKTGVIILYLENKGLKDISGFRVTSIGDSGVNTSNYDSGSTLVRGQVKGFRFYYGNVASTDTAVSKIQIYPKIVGSPQTPVVTCDDPNLVFDSDFFSNVADCNATSVTWEGSITTNSPTG